MKMGIKFAIVTGLQVLCLVGMIGFKYRSLASGKDVILEVPRPRDPRSLFSGDYVIVRYAINHLSLENISNDVSDLNYNSTVYVELTPNGAVWAPVRVSSGKPDENNENNAFIKGKVTNYQTSGKLFLSFSQEQIDALNLMARKYADANKLNEKINTDIAPLKELDLTNLTSGKTEFPSDSMVYVSLVYSGGTLRATAITKEKPNEYLDNLFVQGTVDSSTSYLWIDVEYGIENCFVPESTGHNIERILREVQKAKVHLDPGGHATIIGVPDQDRLHKCGS